MNLSEPQHQIEQPVMSRALQFPIAFPAYSRGNKSRIREEDALDARAERACIHGESLSLVLRIERKEIGQRE